MSTLVCFHAHPDDEALATGGLMAKAAEAGHRVVLVTATRGELGEPQPGVLAEGEELWQRRLVELAAAAEALGADAPRVLGYHDSGMMGEPSNADPACFWQADPEEAARSVAAILHEVAADVFTIYDDHGGYGHPDHIQVHRVGLTAARLAGIEHVYESTMNRDGMIRSAEEIAAQMEANGEEVPQPRDFDGMGTPEAGIAYKLDVSAQLDRKRAAMIAHRSQIAPDSFFLAMPDDRYTKFFGYEWFNIPGHSDTGGPTEVDLLPGL